MNEPLNDNDVKQSYADKVSKHSDINSVLDAGDNPVSKRVNVLHDYFSKRNLLNHLKPKKNDVILDFGTGVGRLSSFISNKCSKVHGVDASPEMIKVAEKNKDKRNDKTKYHAIECHILPFQDNTFDKAFAYWVLASISNTMLEKIIPEIYRVMKPGSKFYFFEQIKQESSYEQNIHKKRTIEEYQALCQTSGFVFKFSKPVQRMPSYAIHYWKKFHWLGKGFLPLLYRFEKLTLKRKTRFVDYYTQVFVFQKK